MSRWIEMKLPTEWANVQKHYVEEEDTIYIVGWRTEDKNEKGKILARINVSKKELEYFDPNADLDGFAQAMIILALHDIETGKYNHIKD